MSGQRICKHDKLYDDTRKPAETRTLAVMVLTLLTMVTEIAAGYMFNSMALMADGWHMSSHAVAMGLAVLAYVAARRYATDRRFAFGTWKMEVLGGFVSALFLIGVAAMMVFMSVERLLNPVPTRFSEAMVVAVVGLCVNLLSAWMLGHGAHGHGHDHDHAHVNGEVHSHDHGHSHDQHEHHSADEHPRAYGHDHAHQQTDLNLRGAYLHVLADALTSVLAIVALLGGMMYGLQWLDPVMGIIGAVVVAVWARGLLRDTSRILLDAEMDHPLTRQVNACIDACELGGSIDDLHVWRIGRTSFACMATLIDVDAEMALRLRERLLQQPDLVHVTVSVSSSVKAKAASFEGGDDHG